MLVLLTRCAVVTVREIMHAATHRAIGHLSRTVNVCDELRTSFGDLIASPHGDEGGWLLAWEPAAAGCTGAV